MTSPTATIVEPEEVPADVKPSHQLSLNSKLSSDEDLAVHSEKPSGEATEKAHSSDSPPGPVTWDGPNDPENPLSWSTGYKWFLTFLCSFMTLNVTFATSAPTATINLLTEEFNTPKEVADLVVSTFLLGYVFGPLFWAPGSELIGRRPVFILTLSCYTLLHLGQALARNPETLLITRFLAGFFAVAPVTNCTGVIADIWPVAGRGLATNIFTACVFLGSVMGPVISGFIIQSNTGWRWVFWVMMAFAGACTIATAIFLPETYGPIILANKAKRLRILADNEKQASQIYAEHERRDWSLSGIVHQTLYRPFQMLALEPILVLVTVYLSLVYGLIYALFPALPVVFVVRRGFSTSEIGLIFLGVGIGTTLGAITNHLLSRDYPQLIKKWRGFPPAENRLRGAVIGGPALVIGCFWLGWTGEYASIHWVAPALATVLVGFGIILVFISFSSYLVDTYLIYSATAFAANTVVRSAVAAAFPVFTERMFLELGINWACTLIGLVALLLAPSPLLFMKYGQRIRARSQFAPCMDLKIAAEIETEEKKQEQENQSNSSSQLELPATLTKSTTDTVV
ncbi:hypothetical protein AX16_010910 [Volvariella volvacea WC 439]|nr:hypothetical protein AX16_010910 [Volvariella volvacea WC 439]